MPRVHASQVARADLPSLLNELRTELRYAYVETATDSVWSRFAPEVSLVEAVRGRAFGPGCEVQFQRDGDSFRVVLITDGRPPVAWAEATIDLATYDSEETRYLLWGVYSAPAGAWVEPGFARRWQYPLDGRPPRVGVRATEYRDRATGDLQFVRYLDLLPIEDGQ
jgi:hypothetical protein